MVALGSSCKCRFSLAEMFDSTETIINQLLADSYQKHISKWQVTLKQHLVAGYKAIHSTHLWRNFLPQNQPLVSKMLGTAILKVKHTKFCLQPLNLGSGRGREEWNRDG